MAPSTPTLDLSWPDAIDTDVLVVGAGPAGLFQVFQLGLLGLRVALIDALPAAGGQCLALYPDKPIYDVPGLPVCTGRELTERLLLQARPFLQPPVAPACGPLWQHLVASVEATATGWQVGTTDAHTGANGPALHCKAVVLATGAGAFVPRGLGLPGLEALHNVHHQLPTQWAEGVWAGQHVVVAGGGEEALDSVLQLLALPMDVAPARLTLLHRRAVLQGPDEAVQAVQMAIDAGRITLSVGLPTGFVAEGDRLRHLNLLTPESTPSEQPADQLLVRLGLSPKLGPLAQWGVALARKQVQVDAATMATNLPGIHAIGDAVTYPGKLRLIVTAFHEATLAAHAVARQWVPEHPVQPLYTTTSAVLHDRLGIRTQA